MGQKPAKVVSTLIKGDAAIMTGSIDELAECLANRHPGFKEDYVPLLNEAVRKKQLFPLYAVATEESPKGKLIGYEPVNLHNRKKAETIPQEGIRTVTFSRKPARANAGRMAVAR